jgi:predicted phage tail protein
MTAVKVWGVFLIVLGAGLLIFNKAWVTFTKTHGLVPFYVRGSWFPRLLTVGVGFAMVVIGVMALLARHY